MWTRIYLTLVAIRLYFALSPSYIHPDENFQGPEVIAGRSSSLAPMQVILPSQLESPNSLILSPLPSHDNLWLAKER